MLALENVGYLAGGRPRRVILRDLDLELRPGELVALLGPNGAGKSTALRIAAGELRPDQGFVRLSGRTLDRHTPLSQARLRAVLPQGDQLSFDLTVAEVVQLGRLPHDLHGRGPRDRLLVEAALLSVGLDHLAERLYPSLSGGERQRVQLARALAQLGEPQREGVDRLLLLDEPTASLDPKHQHQVMALVQRLTRQRIGALVVMHDLNLAARFADRLVFLKDGQKLAEGPPERVLNAQLLEQVYDLPFTVRPNASDPCWIVVPGGPSTTLGVMP
jgi:iron complex transport system ATP-binding protein